MSNVYYTRKGKMGGSFSFEVSSQPTPSESEDAQDAFVFGTSRGIQVQGTPGKSAYDIAKEYGFTGTEEEFAKNLTTNYNNSKSLYQRVKEEDPNKFITDNKITEKDFYKQIFGNIDNF